MAVHQDQGNGFFPAGGGRPPLEDIAPIDTQALEEAYNGFILSASGWRKLFAESEEDTAPNLRPADKLLIAAGGVVFSRFIRQSTGKEAPLCAVGIDSRYTGPAAADILIRIFLSRGLRVRFISITPSPEIMAYTKLCPEIDAFAYVTASHNPIGYNGLKFGSSGGSVIGGKDAAELINAFRSYISREFSQEKLIQAASSVAAEAVKSVYSEAGTWKKEAESHYKRLIEQAVSGREKEEEILKLMDSIKKHIAAEGLGIVIDMNGSARCRGIDTSFFADLGIEVRTVNGRAGEIRHEILPEGEALDLCRKTLAEKYAADRRFKLAYMPDNDGDRGNIVFMDEEAGRPVVLEAQEVFSLVCLAELAWMEYSGMLKKGGTDSSGKGAAVVVNGPTSLRIERISSAFGVKTLRAEVGEANVVGKAAELRDEGVQVRILGEGSNGGSICHPAGVRDPLAAVFSFIKLLYIRSTPEGPGLFEIWCSQSGRRQAYRADYGLQDILRSLPCFETTETGDPLAKMQIKNPDYSRLKLKYESIFLRQWHERKELLEKEYGVYSWEEINYEGTQAGRGFGPAYRSGLEKGGLKILFRGGSGRETAFIWMRPSGTEPVFRIAADAECGATGGSTAALRSGTYEKKNLHDYLLHWQREMIEEADLTIGS